MTNLQNLSVFTQNFHSRLLHESVDDIINCKNSAADSCKLYAVPHTPLLQLAALEEKSRNLRTLAEGESCIIRENGKQLQYLNFLIVL